MIRKYAVQSRACQVQRVSVTRLAKRSRQIEFLEALRGESPKLEHASNEQRRERTYNDLADSSQATVVPTIERCNL